MKENLLTLDPVRLPTGEGNELTKVENQRPTALALSVDVLSYSDAKMYKFKRHTLNFTFM